MLAIKPSLRLPWLAAALCEQRRKISRLFGRLSGLGAPGGMKPRVFRKFTLLLEQVASARDKEMDLLSQIEFVEQKTSLPSRSSPLSPGTAEAPESPEACFEMASVGPQPTRTPLWLLVLWLLFMRNAISQKKQGLTLD